MSLAGLAEQAWAWQTAAQLSLLHVGPSWMLRCCALCHAKVLHAVQIGADVSPRAPVLPGSNVVMQDLSQAADELRTHSVADDLCTHAQSRLHCRLPAAPCHSRCCMALQC